MKFRPMLFLVSLLLSLALHLQRQYHGLPVYHGIALYFELVWNATLLPFAWQWRLLNTYIFGLDPDSGRYTFFLLLFSLTFWFFPVGRVERWFGTFDAFKEGNNRRRPLLMRGAADALDALNKRLFGRQKTGGWAFIGMLATTYRRGDYFLGRMSLFGRFGTLWPSGIKPDGLGVTIGRPGSGKTTGAGIMAVVLHDGSTIVFDPKQGEITKACAAVRGAGGECGERGRGDKVCIIDPADQTGIPAKARYNPLFEIAQEKSTDDALRLIFKLAEGLVKTPDGGGGENSWVYDGAREFAYGLIAFIVDCYPPQLCNLVTLRRLLQEGDRARYEAAKAAKVAGFERLTPFDALLLRMMEENRGRFGHVIAGQAADVQKMADRQRGPIMKALSEATRWLDLQSFQETVSGCDFLLRDFRSEQISLFICLPLNELTGIAAGFARMFLTLFMQTMYRNPVPPKKPVLCLVDEWVQFGKISDFCKIGPTMRSYGVKLHILLQDISQAVQVYGREETSTFLGCAAFVQIMAMTHDETISWLVRSLGERLIKERQPEGRIVSRPYPLLDPEQARRFLRARDGNQIVLRFQDRPLRLKVAPYYWFLPFWMYTPNPDPKLAEPFLRAWARRQAVKKANKEAAEKIGTQAAGGTKSCPA